MPQSLSRVLVHLISSVKERAPVLTPSIQKELYPYLAVVLRENDCPCLKAGGWVDHVHLFFGLPRKQSIAETVETVKTSSSKWIKTKGAEFGGFHWQTGYGAFSVSQSDADAVIKYVEDQAEHHRTKTFQEEYRKFLQRYQVPYDERCVWD
jgi:REP element-mobilizing transposase RayT